VNRPLLSIIIPTYNRPHLLPRAIESALSQTMQDLEVVVVDDRSEPPLRLHENGDPRVKLIRQPRNRGSVAALNAGARAARGRWIAHLDDDDRLLPHMAEVSLDALSNTLLPPPVAVISGIEEVNPDETVRATFLPPTRPRGQHFSLEQLEPGRVYETRNTCVIERDLLFAVGLWDESLRSSARHELFLRLNPVCSILGLPVVTYQRFHHGVSQVHLNHACKHESFVYIEQKHRALFEAHPERYAHYLRRDADRLFLMGQRSKAITRLAHALRLTPLRTVTYYGELTARKLRNKFKRTYQSSC
jgi:hypothetical protein